MSSPANEMELPGREERETHQPWVSDKPDLLAWDTLLEVEDLLSAAQRRNVADTKPEASTWSATLSILEDAFSNKAPPRAPIVAISERIGAHLAAIIAAPRRVLKRERRPVRIDDVRVMDAASRRWLARRPGVALRDKADARGRVLAVIRRPEVANLENRVVRFVVDEALRRGRPFLKRHGETFNEHKHVRAVRKLSEAARRFIADEELGQVPRVTGAVRGTFLLLRDVHYRAIWDVYTDLMTMEETARIRFASRARQHQDVMVLVVAATLQRLLGSVLDGRIKIDDVSAPVRTRISPSSPAVVFFVARRSDATVLVAVSLDEMQVQIFDPAGDPTETFRIMDLPEALSSPLQRSIASAQDAVLDFVAQSGLDISSFEAHLLSVAPQPKAPPYICVAGPWYQGALSGVVCSALSDDDFRIDGSPIIHEAAGALRLSDDVWSALESGDSTAAASLLDPALAENVDLHALVVPDSLGLRARAALRTQLGHQATWLLPRSVASVLGVGEALSGDTSAVTLTLGGPSAELHRLTRRETYAPWQHRWGARTLPFSAVSLVRRLILESLLRQGLHTTDDSRAVSAALVGRTALTGVFSGSDCAIDVPLSAARWTRLTLRADDARALARAAVHELFLSLPELHTLEGPVVIEGWCAGLPAVRDAVTERLETRRTILAPDAAMVGTAAFLSRHDEGIATWVEVLPRVELMGLDARRNRDWHVMFQGAELAPGQTLSIPRKERWASINPGPFHVDLPVRMEGVNWNGVWDVAGRELKQSLDFSLEVGWRAGMDGLVVRLIPEDRTPPLLISWSSPGNDHAAVANQFPEVLSRAVFSRAGALGEAVRALEHAVKQATAPRQVEQALDAVKRYLPLEGWEIEPDRPDRALIETAERLGHALLWFLGEKTSAGKAWRKEHHLDDRRHHLLAQRRVLRNTLQCAGRLGGLAPGELVAAVAQRLRHVIPDRKGRFGDTAAEWGEDDELVEQLLHAAGRLLAGPPSPERGVLHAALVRFGSMMVQSADKSERTSVCHAWSWAVGTGLLIDEHSVERFVPDDVARVTEILCARGTALARGDVVSDERNEIVLALLGLLRVRKGSEVDYGPHSAWSQTLLETLRAWRLHADDALFSKKMRFNVGSAPSAWTVLEEMLEGRHPSLATVVNKERR